MFGFGGSKAPTPDTPITEPTTTFTNTPSATDTLNSYQPSSNSSASDTKTRLMKELREEAALTNAKQLIEKVNHHCFEKCIPTPGATFSSGESTCFSQCADKYMDAWNTVSRHYVARLQESAKSRGVGQGGPEMF